MTIMVKVVRRNKYVTNNNLRNTFRHYMYDVDYVDNNIKEILSKCHNIRNNSYNNNFYSNNSPILIVTDDMTTNVNSKELRDILEQVLRIDDVDIIYLNKSNTIHCALITPRGRDILLGYTKMRDGNKFKITCNNIDKDLSKAISNDNISAISLDVNLFFNASSSYTNTINTNINSSNTNTNNSSNSSDSKEECNECAPLQLYPEIIDNGTQSNVVVNLIIVIIIILVLSWALINVGPS